MTWQEQAACKGMDPVIFHPPIDRRRSRRTSDEHIAIMTVKAKRVCGRCPVVADCLAYAIDNAEDDGVWGGMDPAERERIVGRRRRCDGCRRAFTVTPARSGMTRYCSDECRDNARAETVAADLIRRGHEPQDRGGFPRVTPSPVDWSTVPEQDDPRARAADAMGQDSWLLGRVG